MNVMSPFAKVVFCTVGVMLGPGITSSIAQMQGLPLGEVFIAYLMAGGNVWLVALSIAALLCAFPAAGSLHALISNTLGLAAGTVSSIFLGYEAFLASCALASSFGSTMGQIEKTAAVCRR